MNDKVQLVKDFFKAFASGDRGFVEAHLSDDFQFSSPPDPQLDKAGFFERCWPGAGNNQDMKFIRAAVLEGDEVVITYEQAHPDGSWGRNTEVITVSGGKLTRSEVYFGWDIKAK